MFKYILASASFINVDLGFINRESYVAQYIALAILIMGIFVTIGSDGLLG